MNKGPSFHSKAAWEAAILGGGWTDFSLLGFVLQETEVFYGREGELPLPGGGFIFFDGP